MISLYPWERSSTVQIPDFGVLRSRDSENNIFEKKINESNRHLELSLRALLPVQNLK